METTTFTVQMLKQIIRVVIAVDIKYPSASVFGFNGDIKRSFLAPVTLSLMLSRFDENATVIHDTDKSEDINCPPTTPFIKDSLTKNPSIAEEKASL